MKSFVSRISSSLVVSAGATLAALMAIVAAAVAGNGPIALLEALICGWLLAHTLQVAERRAIPSGEIVGHAVAAESREPAVVG